MGLLATSTSLATSARGPHPAELPQVPQGGLSGADRSAGSRAGASGTEGKGLDQIISNFPPEIQPSSASQHGFVNPISQVGRFKGGESKITDGESCLQWEGTRRIRLDLEKGAQTVRRTLCENLAFQYNPGPAESQHAGAG